MQNETTTGTTTGKTPTHGRVLVIAASGKTGRRVATLLEARGVAVRRGSRSGEGAEAFDWADRATWGPALARMDAAYVVYTPDLCVPSAAGDLSAFVEVAKQRGVKKLVLLSGRGEPEARACEEIVEGAGLAWTIVRAGWFSQNFSEGEFAGMVADGVLALPNPGVREPYIDVDDIAEVAAAALSEPGHDGEVYEVTGPELLSYAEVAQQLSEAAGREIRYKPITDEQCWDGMRDAGAPEEYVELLKYLFSVTASGVNAHISDGVERALGRKPRTFRAFAQRSAARGAWKGALAAS